MPMPTCDKPDGLRPTMSPMSYEVQAHTSTFTQARCSAFGMQEHVHVVDVAEEDYASA